jgi:hypothetical protein
MATGYRLGGLGFDSREYNVFLFFTAARPTLGPGTCGFFSRDKATGA